MAVAVFAGGGSGGVSEDGEEGRVACSGCDVGCQGLGGGALDGLRASGGVLAEACIPGFERHKERVGRKPRRLKPRLPTHPPTKFHPSTPHPARSALRPPTSSTPASRITPFPRPHHLRNRPLNHFPPTPSLYLRPHLPKWHFPFSKDSTRGRRPNARTCKCARR